jgi:hypothetical protein
MPCVRDTGLFWIFNLVTLSIPLRSAKPATHIACCRSFHAWCLENVDMAEGDMVMGQQHRGRCFSSCESGTNHGIQFHGFTGKTLLSLPAPCVDAMPSLASIVDRISFVSAAFCFINMSRCTCVDFFHLGTTHGKTLHRHRYTQRDSTTCMRKM